VGKTTGIAWTDHTFNPWWGCTRVSPGCDHCYADAWAQRTGLHLWDGGERRFFSDKHWAEPLSWNAQARKERTRRRVFCASMCDVFEDPPHYEVQCRLNTERDRLWELIARTPALDWLLLTKRPENMRAFVPRSWAGGWPANVWAMATIENQPDIDPRMDARLGALLRVPAEVRGISAEPLLGLWSIAPWLQGRIHWLIIGCEKLPGNRPGRRCLPETILSLVIEAKIAGVAAFVKQVEINGRVSADPAEWPEELRVQEFPVF